MKQQEGTTVLGRGTKLRGDLTGTEELLIEGELEGTIRMTGGRLTVGAEAQVKASIVAPEVIVFGKVEGDIRSTGRVELRSSAKVLGNVFATRFSMEENAILRGQVDPARASEPVSTPAQPQAPDPMRLAPAVYSKPAADATRPGLSTTGGGPVGARVPNLFTAQPTPQSGRPMPSALAAFASGPRSGSEKATVDEEPKAGE